MKSLNGVAVVATWSVLAAGGVAHAQEAVQWRFEDGGNGHWYAFLPSANTWADSQSLAESLGGHLVTIASIAEQTACFSVTGFEPNQSVWIGLFQNLTHPEYSEPAGGWQWVTGEVLAFAAWTSNSPNNNGGAEHFAEWTPNWGGGWNDMPAIWTRPAILEWSADCNADGIVDYGQILDGTFADADSNGVPDCCDDGSACQCVGDVNFDGIVNGADISVLLGFWGLNGKPVAADINKDGQVDGADLAAMLGGWGACA